LAQVQKTGTGGKGGERRGGVSKAGRGTTKISLKKEQCGHPMERFKSKTRSKRKKVSRGKSGQKERGSKR